MRWLSRFGLPFMAGLLLIPLVGHGCHDDDIDREPNLVPIHHPAEERP